MGFHDVLLPTNLDYGTAGGPAFDVQVTRLDSGSEERNLRWAAELSEYDASYGVKTLEDLHLVLRFFRARHGAAFGFRYKDFHDFTSAANGRDAPADDDQVLGVGDGATLAFQLIKRYGDPNVATPYVRPILKPAHGPIRVGDGATIIAFDTVVVAVDGVAQTEGADYTIDPTTGIVTFSAAPANGLDVTAGFEFHVPVRFDTGKDALQASIDSFDSSSTVSPIRLVELRADDVVVREDYFYGDNLDIESLEADTVLPIFKRSVRVRACDGIARLILPDPTDTSGKRIQPGVVHYAIFNHDLTNDLEVRDHEDNLVVIVPSQDGRTINLCSNVSDTTTKRYFLTDTDDGVALPVPLNGTEDYLLSETEVAQSTYSKTLGANSSTRSTWLAPEDLPGLLSWAGDAGHTLVIEVTDVIGLGVSVANARLRRVNAGGTVIEQSGTPSSDQAISAPGTYTFNIPTTAWGAVDVDDRFVLDFFWQALTGGSGTVLEFILGTEETYLDTTLQDPPRVKQWIGF